MSQVGKIYSLIPKIMSEVGAIEKGRKNTQQNYSFRGIDDVYAAMQAPLSRHGVFYTPTVLEQMREEREGRSGGNLIYTVLKVQFRFFADDGSFVDAVTVGEAMDSGDKSANKAMSAALKYAILQIFCIPTEDDNDTENHSPEVKPRIQAAPAAKDVQKPKSRAIAPKKADEPAKEPRPREALNAELMKLYRPYLAAYPETRFIELLQTRYGVGETRLMTVEQIENLLSFMGERLQSAAGGA